MAQTRQELERRAASIRDRLKIANGEWAEQLTQDLRWVESQIRNAKED